MLGKNNGQVELKKKNGRLYLSLVFIRYIMKGILTKKKRSIR